MNYLRQFQKQKLGKKLLLLLLELHPSHQIAVELLASVYFQYQAHVSHFLRGNTKYLMRSGARASKPWNHQEGQTSSGGILFWGRK